MIPLLTLLSKCICRELRAESPLRKCRYNLGKPNTSHQTEYPYNSVPYNLNHFCCSRTNNACKYSTAQTLFEYSVSPGAWLPSGPKGKIWYVKPRLLLALLSLGKIFVENLLEISLHTRGLSSKNGQISSPLFYVSISGRDHYVVLTEKVTNHLLREKVNIVL